MSIGIKLGRAIGTVGALTAHGVVAGFEGLGEFGGNVVTGIEEGYDEKSAYLALPVDQRRALKAEAQALKAQRAAPIGAAPSRKAAKAV
jgi:hypothetical protein